MQISVRSAGPRPLSVSHTSQISSELPMALPSGRLMSVIKATVLRPTCSPMETIASASRMESSTVFMNAPLPSLTSSRMQSEPAAIFLLMML